MYVTKEQLELRAKKPRVIADVEIPGLGTCRLQAITAREFARIDAARNRAIIAAANGKTREQIAALQDQFMELVKAVFVEPAFTEADRELLLALDSETADAMREAAYAHCSLRDADLEDAEKN